MHEAAMTEALIEQVRLAMPDGTRLEVCRVDVGDLEHLDAIVMETIWRAMTAGSSLEGARLEIERRPVRVRCGACGEEFEPEDKAILLCPACGVVRPELLSGAGVVLKGLEVEEAV